jgi:hypothetical protein
MQFIQMFYVLYLIPYNFFKIERQYQDPKLLSGKMSGFISDSDPSAFVSTSDLIF